MKANGRLKATILEAQQIQIPSGSFIVQDGGIV